ncbi:putative UDP-glucose 4-epimerase [Staphylococcus nepalensis]|uniref:Putative UDP-glucose 4-epimerase n=1 Tax=Staphylococcus nepalensis TaxID=214473 RepID=A0A380GNS1_9STAP|nr:hypothetical protein GCM10007203_18250 [Staphylococcus nepalensis]SUM56056.1 putative UDP-glucose 4-epimerase [Staphylococcus nepalensis]VDG68032.1 nucleoside-diphosphate-sugar epimerase [Lacrimispora indolis]
MAIVIDNEASNGKIYNLATGTQISLLQIFEKFKLIYNKSISYQFAEPRSGDIKHSCAEIKGLEALGFKPKYDIVSGLTEYINYSKTDK